MHVVLGLISSSLIFCVFVYSCNSAYANGFSKSSMVCSGFEKYKASFCLGIKPLILKGALADNFSIRLELYDYSSNNPVFANATFVVSVTKNEYDSTLKDMPFFSGIFNTRNGRFTININNSDKEKIIPSGETILTGLNPGVRTDLVNLTLPLELTSGQYRFQTTAYVNNREPLYFDSDVQVGDIESKDIVLNKTVNNITIISYYDKITDLDFNANKRSITWQMPFEYNSSKIDMKKVNVHQEIVVPNSFLNLTHTGNFNMTMNDRYFNSSYFYVDPYSLRNKTIIHYVPNTNTLFDMSYNDSTIYNHIMKFVLFL
jgi:hypothetical protein